MILNIPAKHWECPKCDQTAVTRHPNPTALEYHLCKGMKNLCVPMVPKGTKAKVVANEREDYIGKENVQTDADGRPVMNVIIERDDGTDCTVYAPIANVRKEN